MSIKQRLARIESKAVGIVRYDETMARVGIVNGLHNVTHPLYGCGRVVRADDPASVERLCGFLDALESFGRAGMPRECAG